MKLKFPIILFFIIWEINLSYSGDIKPLPVDNKTPKIVKSKVNVEIDLSEKIGSFDEKVVYNLEFDNNEMKSVTYVKNLPKINAKYFDLKVDSKDVKITKYEIVEKESDKTLHVEFVNKQGKEIKNSKDGNIKIEYKYKTKDLQLMEESKNKFVLKDVEFVDENNSSYPTKFNVEITNLPKNLKFDSAQFGEEKINPSKKDNQASSKTANLKKRLENSTEKEEKTDKLNLNFKSTMGGNKLLSNKKLRLEFINNEQERKSTSSKITALTVADPFSAPSSPDRSSQLNADGSGVVTKKSYYYKSKKNDDPWESIIAILMLVCLCFLCIQCCNGSGNAPAASKNQNTNHEGPQEGNGDGLNYY